MDSVSAKKTDKQRVLEFAGSLVEGSSFVGNGDDRFLDLLIETGLAAAYYHKHRDRLKGAYYKTFKQIYEGVRTLNSYHYKTISTLKASGVEYYLVKDWCEPLENRYSCDVDVIIRKTDVEPLHHYLQKEGYLLHGVEIFHDKEFSRELFRLNVNQAGLLRMIERHKEHYKKYALEKERGEGYVERHCIDRCLNKLRDAEQKFLDGSRVLPGSGYVYKALDRWRSNKEKDCFRGVKGVLILNSRVHLLFTINKLFGNRGAYGEYDQLFFSLLGFFEGFAERAERDEKGGILKRDHLSYCKGPEFLDIKSRVPALAMASTQDVLLEENCLAPVDNLILNASHFVGNIKRQKKDYSYQGFLKYLLDGAVLIKRHDIDCELLSQRAKKFGKEGELKYYLYLLNKSGLVSYGCDLPETFWFRVLKKIPRYRLLFNENSIYILVVKQAVRLSNRWRVFRAGLKKGRKKG